MNEWEIQNKAADHNVFFNRQFIITVPTDTNKKIRPVEGQVI